MPTVTIQNLTRNRLSLPGFPGFTLTDRQENGLSLVDVILAPNEVVTRKVTIGELERVEPILRSLVARGVITFNADMSPNNNLLRKALNELPVFANTNRPGPTSVPAGTEIFNTDDSAPNFSDGVNWYDANGAIT